MNQAHIHLLLNHVPVLGTAFGTLLLAFGLARRSGDLKEAGLAAFVLVALATIPVYLTGGPAEGVLGGFSPVTEAVIKPHEDSALLSLGAAMLLGVVALAGLVVARRRGQWPGRLAAGTLALSLVVAGLMARTANLGGQIRHTEIRNRAAPPAAETPKER